MAYNITTEALQDLIDQMISDPSGLIGVCVDPSERVLRNLFWRDDMENYTVNKWSFHLGAGVVPAYVNNVIPAFEGDYVLQLNHPNRVHASAGVRFGLIPYGKNSVELRWWKDANTRSIWVYFHLSDGAFSRPIDIRYHQPEERWEYIPSTSTLLGGSHPDDFIAIPGGRETINDNTWNYLRVIGDWENDTYYKLITTGLEIDLTGLSMRSVPLAFPGAWTNLSLIKDTAGINQPAYFDDVRIYLNEV